MFGKLLSMLGFGDDPETAEAKRRMTQDAADPRRRMVFGLLAMSYELDPAYLQGHATTAIREWYDLSSADQLRKEVHAYLRSNDGYDVFRAVFLARAGQGAGMLTEDESWNLAFEAVRRAQAGYTDWPHYGAGYLAGHMKYRKSQGDDEATLARYHGNITQRMQKNQTGAWTVPFRTPV